MSVNNFEIKTLSDYEKHLIRFENFNDQFILPDLNLVVRIDARRLSRKEGNSYPFCEEIQNALLATSKSLMTCGLSTKLAFVHGDEISLILDVKESGNQRKRSRLLSYVASFATAKFIKSCNQEVVFHAKLSELPSSNHILDYLMWQRKVAMRNYIFKITKELLLSKNLSPQEINNKTASMTLEQRMQYAESLGFDFSTVPLSHIYGSLVSWKSVSGKTKQQAEQISLVVEGELPEDDQKYLSLVSERLKGESYSTTE